MYVNENLMTLNRGDKKTEGKKKFSFLKCIPKSNVVKFFGGVLVFSFHIWYLAHPTNRSLVAIYQKPKDKNMR